mgnify:CR=1 FL=1
MDKNDIHPQLQRQYKRVGEFVSLGALKLIFDEAAEILVKTCPQLEVSCTIDDGDHVCLAVADKRSQICIRQFHFVPYATVYRDHGRNTEIKTPTAAYLVSLVKTYFNREGDSHPKRVDDVFDPAIIELAKTHPIISALLTEYSLGALTVEQTLTKMIQCQANMIEHRQAELVRSHQLRTRPDSIILESKAQCLHPEIAAQLKNDEEPLV